MGARGQKASSKYLLIALPLPPTPGLPGKGMVAPGRWVCHMTPLPEVQAQESLVTLLKTSGAMAS